MADDGHVFTAQGPAGVLCNCGRYREDGVHVDPPPPSDPAPARFEDAEVDALAVIVDRMAVLEAETDSGCVHRVIRYLRDRYGTDG